MTLHFMHIGKTGGTAIKRTLTGAGLAYWRDGKRHKVPETPWGPIKLHTHDFRLRDVPEGDHVFFCVRDPIARFVSGFQSRRSKGGDAYSGRYPWWESERKAFARFETPQQLALALTSHDPAEREFAEWSMSHIRHLGFQRRFTGSPDHLRGRLNQVVYIARQETLSRDWEQMKSIFGFPSDLELPSDPARAHRRVGSTGPALDKDAERGLRQWYDRDYRLLDFLEEVREDRGWAPPAPRRVVLRRKARRGAGRVRKRVKEAARRS